MLELPVTRSARRGGAPQALEVVLHQGIAPDVDMAAASADPAHAFLRAGWFAAAGGASSTLVAKRPDGRVVAALPSARVRAGLPVGRAVPGSYWPLRSFPIALDAGDAELETFFSHRVTR